MEGNAKEKRNNPATIDRVAVIGAGLMGHGIAQVFARHGGSVMLYDNNETVLGTALARIRSNLQLYIEMGLEDEPSVETILSRIKAAMRLRHAVEGAEFVTEAVFENPDPKRNILK